MELCCHGDTETQSRRDWAGNGTTTEKHHCFFREYSQNGSVYRSGHAALVFNINQVEVMHGWKGDDKKSVVDPARREIRGYESDGCRISRHACSYRRF